MTREEAKAWFNVLLKDEYAFNSADREAFKMAIKALESEPLTDTEQRIFLAAMSREENDCKEVCADGSDGGVDLLAVCHSVERKVKKSLWR